MSFYTARLFHDEAALAAMSVTQAELMRDLSGKTVALVGNARALGDTRYGPEIDAHDRVIRINRAPMPARESHGARTDWLALATRLYAQDLSRIAPNCVLWMSHKRKRLPYGVANSDGFYLHPLNDYDTLKTRLGAQPTTGAMMIDLLLKSDLAALDLYGFDFFASLSLSGRRTADRVPHDFGAEAAMVAHLKETDSRLSLKPMK